MADLLSIGQLVSVVMAASTPGMTYYVMCRMHKQQVAHLEVLHQTQIEHMKESCVKCRHSLEDKLGDLGEDLGEVTGRQKELREKTLPDDYVKRRECEKCQGLRKEETDRLHCRISKYHPLPGGQGGN